MKDNLDKASEGYWRESFEREPYYQSGLTFDD
jgi:hypothetical protein